MGLEIVVHRPFRVKDDGKTEYCSACYKASDPTTGFSYYRRSFKSASAALGAAIDLLKILGTDTLRERIAQVAERHGTHDYETIA
jgi:hypothetical protein